MNGYQGGVGRKNWEVGIDVYTLLCIKWIANENLPWSTGNSAQCSVMTCIGTKSKKEGIYVNI